jgi:hypothetical protein
LAFSYWTDKPWFLTEEKFATVLIIPSSWGSQLDGDLHQHRAASVARKAEAAAHLRAGNLEIYRAAPCALVSVWSNQVYERSRV